MQTRSMLALLLGLLALLAFTASPAVSQGPEAEKTRPIDFKTNQFGSTKSEPLESGFVFVDGKYIDAPYVVARKGLAFLINDAMIEAPAKLSEKKVPSGNTDPGVPREITKATSWYDDVLDNYLLEKTAFVQKHHSRDQEAVIMEEVYRALPCVKDAKRHDQYPDILQVTTYSGESHNILLCPPRREVRQDPDSIVKRLESERTHYELRLRKGDCYFFSNGSNLSFGAGKAQEMLPQLVEILRSAKDEATKFKEVQKAGLPTVSQDSFASIVTNFSASTQLEQRVRSLKGTVEEESKK